MIWWFFIGYVIIGSFMVPRFYAWRLAENRAGLEYWWEPKQVLVLQAIGLGLVWPMVSVMLIHERWVDDLAKEKSRLGYAEKGVDDRKAEALGRLDEVFHKLEFARTMYDSGSGNRVIGALRMNSLCSKAYNENAEKLVNAGWRYDEVYDMFNKYVPESRVIDMIDRAMEKR